MRLLIDLRLLFKSGFYYSRYEKILSNLHFGFISIHATTFSITHAFSETSKRKIQFLLCLSFTKHQSWNQIKLTCPNLHHLYSYIHPCTYLEESNNDFRNTFCWNICIPTFSKLTVDVLCLDRQNKKAKNDKKLHLCDVVSVSKSRMRICLSLQDHLYIFSSHTVFVIWSFLNSNVVELHLLTIHKSWGITRFKAL